MLLRNRTGVHQGGGGGGVGGGGGGGGGGEFVWRYQGENSSNGDCGGLHKSRDVK